MQIACQCSLCVKEKRFFDVNRRSVLAMRRIGRGHAALQRFCGIMSMSPPITERAFHAHQDSIASAARTVTERSMQHSAEELRVLSGTNKVAITCDGTWMRRGYSSLFGVFACISWRTGRVIDIHVSSKYCHECVTWNGMKDSGSVSEEAYSNWKSAHLCKINTAKSAPAMESESATILWARSLETRSLMYTTYIGDGDSKGYNSVCANDPYDGVAIEKEECIGHVQKRIGGNRRELLKTMKGKMLSDGRPLTGAGRLTKKTIDLLQSYYGWAVREHQGDLQGMARAIWAGLMHRCSSDDNPQHQWCPEGPDSWCKYQLVQAGARESYTHSRTLPKAVFDAIKPIYLRLTNRKLLERCLIGSTQNANESFNAVIWGICPKERFCGVDVVSLACSLAVCIFNHGSITLCDVLKEADCLAGQYTRSALEMEDCKRTHKAERKSSEKENESRKKRRRRRKGWEDTSMEKEGVTYEAGVF